MANFSTRIQVNRPVEHTFRLFLDESVMAHWISGFKGIEIISGEPRETDSLYRMVVRYHKEDIQVYQKIISVKENKSLHIEMEHPEFITHSEIIFIPTGYVTLVECKVKIKGKTLRIKLGMSLVKAVLENRNQWDYQMFKRIAEDIDAMAKQEPKRKISRRS
ncbi:MAG: SRPBCC family protein [Chitinophagales bacterium]|nr:SRPBCC family protein [Chitinophagales bacterium]